MRHLNVVSRNEHVGESKASPVSLSGTRIGGGIAIKNTRLTDGAQWV